MVENANDFKVIRPGKGLGMGLKTKKDFKKGQKIIEYIGIKKKNKDVEEDTTKYLFDLDKNYTIDGSPRWNIARYINHSCRPNAESDVIKGQIWIKAIKNIKAGDEITYDYGKEYFNEFIKPYGCKCVKCLAKK
ncbi:MAG: SET domain-containing protein [Bacteroidetes bacterium]|nr:SET domain-containing protein [Bacteroidota bacterium]